MTKRMLIDATHAEETRVVVLDGNRLEDFDVETSTKKQLKGNIYLAKIVRVEPSLQAAFVEYGGGRHGFLAFGEIHPDYYQIPVADRQRLLAMQEQEAREEQEAEDAAAQADGAAEQASAEAPAHRRRHTVAPSDADPEVPGAEAPADHVPGAGMAGSADHVDEPFGGHAEPDAAPDEDAARAASEAAIEADAAVDQFAPAPDAAPHAADAEAHPPAPLAPEPLAVEPAAAEPAGDLSADADQPAPHRPAQAAMIPQDTRFGDELFEPGHAENHIPGAGSVESIEPDDAPLAYSEAEIVADLEADTGFDEDTQDQPPPATIGGESDSSDGADEARERRSMRLLRNYRIQEVIRRRQIILVQVVKEERGTKGAALTSYISLAGRFCVLMPNSPRGGGISRKITSAADRRRLKEITAELDVPQGMGLIVRTAGAARPKPEIKRDAEYLMRLWDDIREHTMKSMAPALIYEEASLIKRSIRDVYSRDVDEILVDGEEGWRTAHDFMRMLMPSHAKKVQLWRPNGGTAPQPLFSKFAVESQLDSMLSPTVQLKSGGYLVINQTEALVAIDVNSGRSTRERGIEETALRTNLEASDEVARQLRLRDLAGLIVIDYIDMEARKHNAAVERRLTEALKNDRARIQVGHISHFGLMEMSRQRLRPSLAETSFVMCPHCQGAGLVRSIESSAVHVLREIEDEGAKAKAGLIMVHCANAIAMYLLNNKRDRLGEIELRYAMRVHFTADETLPPPQIRIDRLRPPVPEAERLLAAPVLPAAPSLVVEDDIDEAEDEVIEDVSPPRHQPAAKAARPAAAEPAVESEESQRRRRRRRRRGGRREGSEAIPSGANPAPGVGGEVAGGFEDDAFAFESATDTGEPNEIAPVVPTLDAMAAGVTGLEGESAASDETQVAAVADPADEQPAVDPADLDENGLPRARRRGRRGGRRRRRDGTFGEEPAAEAEPQAVSPPPIPAYVGPTPADPFGGHAFDIFDMMDEVESRPVATVAARPAAPPPAPVTHEPALHGDAAVEPVQGSLEMPHPATAIEHPKSAPAVSAPEAAEPVPVVPAEVPSIAGPEAGEATIAVEAEPPAAPVIQPIVIGQDPLPAAAPKKGWWRR